MKFGARVRDGLQYYLEGLYRRGGRDHLFLLSGGLAFSVFLCMIPLVLVLFSLLGTLVEQPLILEKINALIDRAIPYRDYADVVRTVVLERVHEFRLYKSLAGTVGIAGLFFASSGLFSSMRTILSVVYRMDTGSSLVATKARDLAMVLVVLLFFLLFMTIVPISDFLAELGHSIGLLTEAKAKLFGGLVKSGGSFVLILFTMMLLFSFVPPVRIPWKVSLVSAVSTAVLWEMSQFLFRLYLAYGATLKRVYGAYLIGVAAVLWIYVSCIVFTLGAQIGQLYGERRGMTRGT